jgi:hypothetical protein
VAAAAIGRPVGGLHEGFRPACAREAEKRGKLIKAASERQGSAGRGLQADRQFQPGREQDDQICRSQSAKCGIPPQIGDQLKAGHKNTESDAAEGLRVAQQMRSEDRPAPASAKCWALGGAPGGAPVKKGGSTFDTLNGNVLSR